MRAPSQRVWKALGLASRPHLLLQATAYAGLGEIAYFQEFFVEANRRQLLFDTELEL